MSKTSDYTVTSSFVWDKKIMKPGNPIALTDTQAAPLKARGKVEPGKPPAKKAPAKTAAKPAAKTEGGKD
ncbi:hypothetical protein [Parasedimentitalea psychrophila]|uniref:Uncharacterized protein n=1 Tax=Parasedimentitalea psychrophila TaxID=2997337 RepID=A0A9Y2KXE4_9RHOB|nr:hypothetical protein [Parasedimentitalea psychrophila]WIY23781.1 hypothetical protein QPJ95_14135 [Parasedimentitalea psychrophila]